MNADWNSPEIQSVLEKYSGPIWADRLLMTSLSLHDIFPAKEGFEHSIWGKWVSWIEGGWGTECSQIEDAARQRPVVPEPNDLPFDPSDWVMDSYWQAENLANAMYATLVVSLWANMESFLKSIVRIIALAEGLKKEPPYKFDQLLTFFEHRNIVLKSLPQYNTIDGIRILNNAYKHDDGEYRPVEEKDWTQIHAALLVQWQGITEGKEIQYSRLPIKELAIACHLFCDALIQAVEKRLKVAGAAT